MVKEENSPWRLTYSGVNIDRSSSKRSSMDQIENLRVSSDARIIPIWDGRNFFKKDGSEAQWLSRTDAENVLGDRLDLIFLGVGERVQWFALSLIDDFPPSYITSRGTFESLHGRVGALDADQAALLAYARGMVLWHLNHLHCGRCGSVTYSREGGHVRLCANENCSYRMFPRTDPAVITLVVHPNGDKCLLGRQGRWPKGMYSIVAGFVEPGESLEECVKREVEEETGIRTSNIRYVASQPWPFPSSLMLGFTAQAADSEFSPHDDELEDIRWVTKEELSTFGEMGDESHAPKLPNKHSIARMLIDRWRNS